MAHPTPPPPPPMLTLLDRLLTLVAGALFLGILFYLAPLAFPYVTDAKGYPWVQEWIRIDDASIRWVRSVAPTHVAGVDIARWIIIGGLFAVRMVVTGLRYRIANIMYQKAMERDFAELKAVAPQGGDSRLLAPIKEQMKTVDSRSSKSRAELLKVMAEAKRKLASMGRDLAFLSIDVVDSTKMKLDEEKTDIEHDFHEFKNLVDGKLRAHGQLKSTWTPDGVMACFPNIDLAVSAAQEVLSGLDAFNRNVKMMRTDFVVRCGINAGHVYYDEATPMEEMSDRVIDVAGHMQKYAAPGTIAIAKQAIEPMQRRDGFKEAGKVVDGYEVYHWSRE